MTKATAALKPVAPAPAAPSEPANPIKQAMTEARPPVSALLGSEIWAREAGIKFNTWEVVPPAGTSWENVMSKEFWANVSSRMRPGDQIIIFPRDGSYFGQLVVWDAGQNWAHVSGGMVERPSFDAAPGVEGDFDVRRDPIDGIMVVRKSTGAKVKGNFANHEDARRWMLDHQRAMRT